MFAQARARFFNEVRACRRRAQVPVEDTPVGRFLTKASELGLLHRRAVATRIRFALAAKGLRIADGFAAMDRSKEGTLSPAELSKGMEWLGLKLCPRCKSRGPHHQTPPMCRGPILLPCVVFAASRVGSLMACESFHTAT
jgi:hypothetical protein